MRGANRAQRAPGLGACFGGRSSHIGQILRPSHGFSKSSEMLKDRKLIFCMLQKDDLCFMLNQRAGRPRIYTRPEIG